MIFAIGSFDQIGNPCGLDVNIQLLGPVIDIHQKQIVEKKIFYKIILVKPFFVGDKQTFNLKHRHLCHHIHALTLSVS